MKKFTSTLLGLMVTLGMSAQTIQINPDVKVEYLNEPIPAAPLSNSNSGAVKGKNNSSSSLAALGDTIQYFNFNSSTGWTVQGSTARGWTIGNNSTWYFGSAGINSTSGAGWACMNPADPRSGSLPAAMYALTSPAVNCAGKRSVVLEFEQFHARFQDTTRVQVSTNGTDWTTVYDNMWLPATTAASGNQATANPMKVSINVTRYVGNAASAQVRFWWRSRATGSANDGVGYGWFIDDVFFKEGANNAIKVNHAYVRPLTDTTYLNYENYYSKQPVKQANQAPLVISGEYENSGGEVQSNVSINVTAAGPSGYSETRSSPTKTLAYKGVDSNSVTGTPVNLNGGAGMYNVGIYGTSDSTLHRAEGDSVRYLIEATDSVYARDELPTTSGSSVYYNPTVVQKYTVGVLYEVFAADTVTSVSFFINGSNSKSNHRGKVQAQIFNAGNLGSRGIQSLATAPQFASQIVDVKDLNIPSTGKWVTLKVSNQVSGQADTLNPGLYVVAFEGDQFFGTDTVFLHLEGRGGWPSHYFLRQDQGSGYANWSYSANRQFIRLNTKPKVCPVLNGVVAGSPTTACGNTDGSVTVSTDPTNGSSPFSYRWDINGSTQNGKTINNLGSGLYTVTITDANGCTQIATANVSDAGAPIISNDNITDVTCAGNAQGSITFSVTPGTNGSNYTFSWTDPKGQPVTGDSSLTGIEAGTYTVQIDDGVCKQTRQFKVNGPTDTLLVNPLQSTNPSCFGRADGSVTYTSATGGTGSGTYSFVWEDNSTNATRTGLGAGTYTVTVTDGNNCTATRSVSLTEPSNISVAILPNTGTDKVTLTANVGGGTPGYLYEWRNKNGDKCRGTGTDGRELEISATANTTPGIQDGNGDYTVNITDQNNCTNSRTYTVDEAFFAPLSVKSMTDSYELSVFPNPSNGSFNLNMKGVETGEYTIEVKNVVGQIVYSTTEVIDGTYNSNVSIANAEAGVYFLTITNGEEDNTIRLVVE